MNELVTGMIHVHSDFSRDGLCAVAELAAFARQAGLGFVGVTDHAEDLSSGDMESLRRQCETHSDESFVMIPGLEFRCSGDIHILGLGITNHIPNSEPVAVATQIEARRGLAILAHPVRSNYQCPPELCGFLSGIEIWNAAYDGRFVPPLASLRLLQKARSCNPAISGFAGVDLHALHQAPEVILQLRVNGSTGVDARMVLQLLRWGRFAVRGRYVSFDAHTGPHPLARVPLWAFRKLYEVSKVICDGGLGGT